MITYFVAISLDGYIAGNNDDLTFLNKFSHSEDGGGYEAFFDSVDALVMGRSTHDVTMALTDGKYPYGDKPSFVLTSKPPSSKASQDEKITFVDKTPQELMADLKDFKHTFLVGGGRLAKAFYEAGLIDRFVITIIPHILGSGIPLFAPMSGEQTLKLIEHKVYSQGLVELTYEKIK